MTFEMWMVASCSAMPPLNVLLRVRLHVLLHHHDALNQEAILFSDDAKDAALLALVLAGDYFNLVITLDLDACHNSLSLTRRASEIRQDPAIGLADFGSYRLL